jgi:hypothetical protein
MASKADSKTLSTPYVYGSADGLAITLVSSSDTSIKSANDKSTTKKLSTFDISECISTLKITNKIPTTTHLTVIKYDMNSFFDQTTAASEIRNNLSVAFNILNPNTGTMFDLSICSTSSTTIGLPVTTPPTLRNLQVKFSLNGSLYNKMLLAGVDIYNPNDPKFNNRCYSVIDPDTGADTSLNYRIKNYFQGVVISCTNGCIYSGIDANNNVICKCNGLPTNLHLYLQPMVLSAVSDFNLSLFNCRANGFGSVSSNPAFWFGTCILIMFILLTPCIYYITYFDECQITNGYGERLANHSNVQVTGIGDDIKRKTIINDLDLTWCGLFYIYLKQDHIILSILLLRSLAFPLWKRFILLLLYLNLIFTFSAFLFTDNLISSRVSLPKSTRDAFFYPISNEIVRVVLILVFSGIIYDLIKFFFKRISADLMVQMESAETSGDISRAIEDINEYKRRTRNQNIIIMLFITVIILLGWYYMIVFNGINTTLSAGWAFGALNAMIIDLLGLKILFILGKTTVVHRLLRRN